MSASQKHHTNTVTLPTFYTAMDQSDHEIIQLFHQNFAMSAQSRDEIKILSSIHKVADVTGQSDAFIAKILVDHGLRSLRLAFPQDFLDHLDQSYLRSEEGRFSCLSGTYRNLIEFWTTHGENPFAFIDRDYARLTLPKFLSA